MVEHVCSVVAVRQIADLVDDKNVRPHVHRESLAELAVSSSGREVVDELCGGCEKRVESVLHRAVRDGDGEVRLTSSGLALENDAASFGNEVGSEQRPDRGQTKRGLIAEVKLLDGAKEREQRGAYRSREAGATSMRDFLGEERQEQLIVGPVLLFGALDELAPDAAGVREVEAFEERFELGAAHGSPRFIPARPRGNGSCPRLRPRGCAARTRGRTPSRPRALVGSRRCTPPTESCPRSTAFAIASRIRSSPCCSSNP